MTAEQFKKYIFISIITLTVLLEGCSSYTIFNTSKEGQRIKPGSIVVIAGSPEEADIRLAELFTEYLKKNTQFTVMSQEAVFEKMPNYPLYSLTKKMEEYGEKMYNSPSMPDDMKKNLAVYNQYFKTDYIFLVWTDKLHVTMGSGTTYFISFFSRLVEFPENNVIGYSSFGRSRGTCLESCVVPFFSHNINIDKMLGSISEDVVEELAKKALGK